MFTAGRGVYERIKNSRIRKKKDFLENPRLFVENLAQDIKSYIGKAKRESKKLTVRLNGTSDIPWESLGGYEGKNLMERFPGVYFYDYTKSPERMAASLNGKIPKNYHLTFSRSESNQDDCIALLAAGANIAIVFNRLPEKYMGAGVIDGDEDDLRFTNRKGYIVGLKAKGKAKKDHSGFVVRI